MIQTLLYLEIMKWIPPRRRNELGDDRSLLPSFCREEALSRKPEHRNRSSTLALQNKVFIMKLEMEAPPLPPSFPFLSCLLLFFPLPLWGLGSTQDNARSWDGQDRLTAG
jgi:hypothetical protein